MGHDVVRAFAPGRTEIAGNHTDHQGGRVIAAALSRGVDMRIRPRNDERATLQSEGFAPVSLSVRELDPVDGERKTTAALVRGVIAGINRMAPGKVRGFDAFASSTLPSGGGLSSSAAFEVALAGGLNLLFLDNALTPVDLARCGQFAEQHYFGKPCGLMDQLTSAWGAVQLMDFAEEAQPHCVTLDVDFENAGYAVVLVDTHCDHSAFTQEYAQVSEDMRAVAQLFGAPTLSRVAKERFFEQLASVRMRLGDTAALRGIHYYHEMDLVDARAAALQAGDYAAFIEATRRSSISSAQYLQNVSVFGAAQQPAMVALALADCALEGTGACRIHGGGFGGSVQAYVPLDRLDSFTRQMDGQFGAGSCLVCSISRKGVQAQWE